MSDFVETMKLVEKAKEDIYFAKIDRELIEGLRRRAVAEKAAAAGEATEQIVKAGQAGKKTEFVTRFLNR